MAESLAMIEARAYVEGFLEEFQTYKASVDVLVAAGEITSETRLNRCRSKFPMDFVARRAAAEASERAGMENARLGRKVAGFEALLKRLPAGKRVGRRERFEWVGDHLDCEAPDVDEGGVPDRLAVSMLLTAIKSAEGREKFLQRHKDVTAGESVADLKLKFEEDAEKLNEFVAKVEKIYREAS
jgi:hypothetical protein